MKHSISTLILGLLLSLMALETVGQSEFTEARALIYSATKEYRHDSIPSAITSLRSKGSSYNIQFDDTEDSSWFKDETLAQYDLLIFLSNTGEVLDANEQAALQRYLNLGGNFAAIHAASDCLRNSTFMDRELGVHFDYHPEITNATINVVDSSHPSTSMLPARWNVYDEMYNFKSDPRDVGAVVILSIDESTYTDPGPRKYDHGNPHPAAWFQDRGAGVDANGIAGRSFYTSLGHTNETWQDELFLSHVMGGISWAIQSGTTRATNASAPVGSGPGSSSSSPTGSQSPSLPSSASQKVMFSYHDILVGFVALMCILV